MAETTETRTMIETLEADLETQKAQLRDLAMMGTIITSMHDIAAVLSVVMDMALRLVDGEVGLIQMEEGGALHTRVSWGVEESFIRLLKYKDDVDLATYCFEHREGVILSDLNVVSDQGMKLQSIIAMPVMTKDKTFGVMTIINKTQPGNFSEADRESLDLLLKYVAVAVDNSLLLSEKLKRQKIEQELAIARQIQETILPENINDIDGVAIGAIYFPAQEVGGDFYDIIPITDTRFMAVMGDVSNKGVPAALVMSACSGILKTLIEGNPEITVADLASSLNDILSRAIIRDREMFVTLFFSQIDLAAGELTYCNAGHIPGLFWDGQAGRVIELAEGGPIVGQFPGIAFKSGRQPLHPGDRLFLFTDGLTEAEDASGELFGRERAEQVFAAEGDVAPHDFCLKVKQWIDRFQQGSSEDSHDDFTLMQIRVDHV